MVTGQYKYVRNISLTIGCILIYVALGRLTLSFHRDQQGAVLRSRQGLRETSRYPRRDGSPLRARRHQTCHAMFDRRSTDHFWRQRPRLRRLQSFTNRRDRAEPRGQRLRTHTATGCIRSYGGHGDEPTGICSNVRSHCRRSGQAR